VTWTDGLTEQCVVSVIERYVWPSLIVMSVVSLESCRRLDCVN